MRQVSKTIKEAFENGTKKVCGNTTTDGQSVWLFDNKIITTDSKGNIYWTMCGWNSRTTMERLKSILDLRLHTVKGCIKLIVEDKDEGGFEDMDVETSAWYDMLRNKFISRSFDIS
jgi:hypothetical protein